MLASAKLWKSGSLMTTCTVYTWIQTCAVFARHQYNQRYCQIRGVLPGKHKCHAIEVPCLLHSVAYNRDRRAGCAHVHTSIWGGEWRRLLKFLAFLLSLIWAKCTFCPGVNVADLVLPVRVHQNPFLAHEHQKQQTPPMRNQKTTMILIANQKRVFSIWSYLGPFLYHRDL